MLIIMDFYKDMWSKNANLYHSIYNPLQLLTNFTNRNETELHS